MICAVLAMPVLAVADDQTVPPEAHWAPPPRARVDFSERDQHIPAVQEADGEAALSRVVDTDAYDVHVDASPKGTLDGKQNTGFAFKRGLTVVRQPDFQALDIRGDGSLRYGTRIDLAHNGQTLQLISVHLKSRCADNTSDSTSPDCALLLAQVPVLEGWIDTAAQGPLPFIVLGDFNRRFTWTRPLVRRSRPRWRRPTAPRWRSSCRRNRWPSTPPTTRR
jgi:endonuclease/exonuclease/phosphatase family metal-dependent hydrolase